MVQPFILLIETATDVCEVAVCNGIHILATATHQEPYSHASVITVLIQQALEEASIEVHQLSAIAVSLGPGSYTALRVGLSAAKGMAHVLDLPIIGVPTLEALAIYAFHQFPNAATVIAMIDARRRVYVGIYQKDVVDPISIEAIELTESIWQSWLQLPKPIYLVGNGVDHAQPFLMQDGISITPLPNRAAFLIEVAIRKYQLGEFMDLAYGVPLYVQSPHITQAKKLF